MAKRFWLSWYHCEGMSTFELHWPWWVSGYRFPDGADTICAAVVADNRDAARELVRNSYDAPIPSELEWRFVEERPEDWVPYTIRFARAAWMRWPDGGKHDT